MEMVKLLNIYLNHFPKHERYSLAGRIRNTAYEMYDLISAAQKRYYKKTSLTELDIVHERLRMQIYLAYELGYLNYKDGKHAGNLEANRVRAIGGLVDELGKMIGGWIKKIKEDNKW